MATKQPEVTDATRKRLVKAFCKLYKSKPIERISVREIVAEAGCSRATFYNYFNDPYALIDHAAESLVHDVFAQIQREGVSPENSNNFVLAFTHVVKENRSYLDIFLNPQSACLLAEKLKAIALPAISHAFGFSADNVVQRLAVEFYISGLVSTLNSWLSHPEEISADQVAETLEKVLWRGILG